MPSPRPIPERVYGLPLRALRRLAEGPAGAASLWPSLAAEYHLAELLGLPPDARQHVELSPRPVAGAPPRQWAHDGRPVTPGHGARLRQAFATGRSDPATRLRQSLEAAARLPCSPFVGTDPAALTGAVPGAGADATARYRSHAPRGPLDGLFVPVKDEQPVAGRPCAAGTTYRHAPAPEDGALTARLRAAGALVAARTVLTEWGMDACGRWPHGPMPRNPRDPERLAGGSSTGAAVAVALGLCPSALGSDGGGSIRIPAAACGVAGLKPTLGRVSRAGDLFGSGSMTVPGPLGATTTDVAELLAVLAGADADDPTTAWAPGPLPALGPALSRGVRGARIGIPEGEWRDADPAIASACQHAVRALQDAGARIVDVRLPHLELSRGLGVLVIASEAAAAMHDELAAHGPELGDGLRLLLALFGQLSARDLLLLQRTRATLRRRVARVLAGVDLLALPALATPPPLSGPGTDRGAVFDLGGTRGLSRFAFLANLCGLPAGVVPVGAFPAGHAAAGLPIALQLVGDAWDEASVLAGLAEVERLVPPLAPPPGALPLP